MAERSIIEGKSTVLSLVPLASGSRVANDIYSGCRGLEDGDLASEGGTCVASALKYMTEALVDLNAGVSTALLSNTINAAQPAKDSDSSSKLLQRMNKRLSDRSDGKHKVHAVELTPSEYHPNDGIAIRTNIRDVDSALRVHTNGSHMTATFKRDNFSAAGPSDTSDTQEPAFGFDGAQGLKLQLRWKEPREIPSDLNSLLPIIAYQSWLKASDSWAFVECDAGQGGMILQGKLILQDDGAGSNFETDGLIDC